MNPGARDHGRWPSRGRLAQQLLLALVHGYRLLLKPWVGNRCRFEPSCSCYALQALQKHGAWRGSALAGWRILRCQPWCVGGHDPVPEMMPRLFSGFAAGRAQPLGTAAPARDRHPTS